MVSIVSRLKKQKNGDHFGSHLLIANHDGRVSFRPWDTFTIAVSGFQRVRESSREKERKRENRGRKGTMRRPFQRAYIVGLTLAGRSGFSFADDLKMNVRSREVRDADFFSYPLIYHIDTSHLLYFSCLWTKYHQKVLHVVANTQGKGCTM